MHGLMMNFPLTVTSIMSHAESIYADSEIVALNADKSVHCYSYADAFRRTRQLANLLHSLGVKATERVGTLAWNDHRHFELYYAIAGIGAVCHTVNPRLFAQQISYIVNHAHDQWLFIDPQFLPLIEQLYDELETVKGLVIMTDAANMPSTSLPDVYCYETLLAGQPDTFEWPQLDENSACSLCYTSGTSGNPKGVLYSHRALVLQSYGTALPDSFNLSCRDVVLPVVPMFHVNAWDTPYASVMVGAKLVLPGAHAGDGATIAELINRERVSVALGVPTVWMAVLDSLRQSGNTLVSLERVITGGSACPLSVMDQFRSQHDVEVVHVWGMTELSPLGTVNTLKPGMESLPKDEVDAIRCKVGRPVYGVEVKIVDDQGQAQPRDGTTVGALKVRGSWVIQNYFGGPDAVDADGWFDTGDVATLDGNGYVAITDRKKDLIKSGGEWISSIELENIAVGHPAIAEAAVIAVPHPKWSERPLLVAVKEASCQLTKQEMLDWFNGKVAKWCVPDNVVFVESLPHTATGKLSKKTLREQFA